jgi:hypothetical protein
MYAKNNGIKIVNGDGFELYNPNPQTLPAMKAGDEHIVSWTLRPLASGDYSSISVQGDPLDSEIPYVEVYLPTLTVNDPPPPEYPDLHVSATLHPSRITQGEISILNGSVECIGNELNCGYVVAHAIHGMENIPAQGYGITTPASSWDCGLMNLGDVCTPSYDLTGNYPGDYSDIRILSISEDPFVHDKSSVPLNLEVVIKLGSIIIDASIDPYDIEINGSTSVDANIDCQGGYCGELSAYLLLSDGTQIGSQGNLTTGDPNPQICQGLHCTPSWDLFGGSPGLYEIRVQVKSNESYF